MYNIGENKDEKKKFLEAGNQIFLTEEHRFLAQTVFPLSGITKGTSLYRGFRKS